MPILTPTNPANCLDLINKAVSAIAKKSEQVSASRIAQRCEQGKAFAFTDKPHNTLIVLEPIADSYPTINVWIAYSEQGNGIKKYEPEIEKLARQIGVKRLTFKSNRKGYKRAMPHWTNTENNYERCLA